MKKLVFMFAAFAAVSFASCGNKTAETDVVADSDSVAVVADSADTTVADSANADTTAAAPADTVKA